MSTVLTANRASTALAALGGLKQALVNVQSTLVVSGGDTLLRLGKDGVWVYGADNIEVEEKSRWAVNPLSIMHGFCSWSENGKGANELVGEVMVPATMALPVQHDLSDTGFPWNQQISMRFKCLTGEDTGTELMYKTTSVGGLGAFNKLLSQLLAQLDKDADNPVPVVELASEFYIHKKWGKTYTPLLELVAWVPLNDDEAGARETAEAAAEPEPAKRKRNSGSVPATKPAEAAPAAPAKQSDVETPEQRKARLRAELEAMEAEEAPAEDGPVTTAANTPATADAAPVRRRRNVA